MPVWFIFSSGSDDFGITQVGFEMLFWGLAGFVDPVAKKKASLGAEPLANLAGVDQHDEFFKDNAIEVKSEIIFSTNGIISERRYNHVLDYYELLLSTEQSDIEVKCDSKAWINCKCWFVLLVSWIIRSGLKL